MDITCTTVNHYGSRPSGHNNQMGKCYQGNWMHAKKTAYLKEKDIASQVRKMYNRAQKNTHCSKGDRFSERDFVNWLVRLPVPLSNWVFQGNAWFYYSPNGEITVLPDMSSKQIEGERLMEPKDIPIILAIHELARSRTDNQETFKFLEDTLRKTDAHYPWTQVINTICSSNLYTPLCRTLWHGNPNIGATLLRMGADVEFENSHGEGLIAALAYGRKNAEELYATNRMMWELEKRSNLSLEEKLVFNHLRKYSEEGKPLKGIQVTRDDKIAVSDKFDLFELQIRSRQKALQQEKDRREMNVKRQRFSYLEKSREWSCLDDTMNWGEESLDVEYQNLKKELDVAPKPWTGWGGAEHTGARRIPLWKLRKTLRDAGGQWKTDAERIIQAHDEKARLIQKGDLERNPSDLTERQELEPLYHRMTNEGEGEVLDGL